MAVAGVIALGILGCGVLSEPFSTNNFPQSWFGSGSGSYADRLAHLPRSGRTSSVPWADTYWPSFLGGVAWRWYGVSQSAR